jgi:hypothetical protein
MTRMHKKGITEEVAKKRSRKNVKVQVGVEDEAGPPSVVKCMEWITDPAARCRRCRPCFHPRQANR